MNNTSSRMFVKLFLLSRKDGSSSYLYGFAIPTEQTCMPWRQEKAKKNPVVILRSIMTVEDLNKWVEGLTTAEQDMSVGGYTFPSPGLVKDRETYTGKEMPFQGILVSYRDLQPEQTISAALRTLGENPSQERRDCMCSLLDFLRGECGIDFVTNEKRSSCFPKNCAFL